MSNFDKAHKVAAGNEGGISVDKGDTGNFTEVDGQKYFVGTRYGQTFDNWMSHQGNTKPTTKAEFDKLKNKFEKQDEKDVQKSFKAQYWDKYGLEGIEDDDVATNIYDAMINQNYTLGGSGNHKTLADVLNSLGYDTDGKTDFPTVASAVTAVNKAVTEKGADAFNAAYADRREESYMGSGTVDEHGAGWLKRINQFRPTEDQYSQTELDGMVFTNDSTSNQAVLTDLRTSTGQVAGTSETFERDEGEEERETQALLKSLKTATDESSGKRSYTVTEDDLKIVDGAEKNIREYYISEYSDQDLDDDDLMMGGEGSSDSESIFDKISTELSSGLDMQTERGQAIFKARLKSYEEKVTSNEYVENLRSTYQGPSLRTPFTNDMAYTNIVQDTNFRLKVLGQAVNSAMKQNDIVIETRDFDALGEKRGVEENLGKIPGTNQDAITTAQIIAKRLAKQGNKELADLLMEEGGSELAGQYILDEIAKQSLNKDEQGTELNFDNLNENLTLRITDPEGYVEETGQTDINQNSKNLLISVEEQDKINETKDRSALAEQAQEAQKGYDTEVFDDHKSYEEWVSKDPKRAEKRKEDPEGLYKEFTNKDAVEKQNNQSLEDQQKKDEQRDKRLRGAEKVLSGLKAAAGVLSLSKALQDPEIDIPEISPLLMEAVDKQRQMAKSGFSAQEKNAAMQGLNDAYAGAMKNVLRASGGQRGMYLANQGTVDANRIQGLNQLAAQDAALHRQNIQQYNSLASSVGQMKLSRDMTAEQMKQTAIAQNKKTLSGIGGNLVSDALSDLSWYMNPNRGLIEQAQKTSLEGLAGDNKDNTWDTTNADYNIAGDNSRATETAEQKAARLEAKRIADLNK